MTLTPGTKLGPYEIQSQLGAGGMGEVYRAKDTRLDRTVAVKILPSDLSDNPEAKQRFDREARAISSLNHSNICTLYDVGHQAGVDYLVMEFLEGETLADRLEKGPLPAEQLLKCGIEICEGLEKAHKTGVIHRDLKPGNIMMTKAGAKLMDFGLAKSIPASARPGSSLTKTMSGVSRDQPLTAQGTVVGTFQYMSPEQVEGKESDARSDIFALGAVLYEMATGKRAFTGKTQASIVAAILASDPPPITVVQPMSPPTLDRVVKVCLAKDPDDRFQTAHDLKLQLQWVMQPSSQAAEMPSRRAKWWRGPLWVASAALCILAALLLGWNLRRPQTGESVRFVAEPPVNARFTGPIVLSSDGRKLAFIATNASGVDQLWIRYLNSLDPQALPGTDGAGFPFWSPDSAHLGFFADGKLKTIALSGGPPLSLCDVADARGGTWNSDDVIVFAPNSAGGLSRIAANGGPVTDATIREEKSETTHRWPVFLPDQRHFLFYIDGKPEVTGVYAGELGSKDKKKVISADLFSGTAPPGFLLYGRDHVLMAQRFDEKKLQPAGEPVSVSPLWYSINYSGLTAYSASQTGILAYRTGGEAQSRLVLVDRTGKPVSTLPPIGALSEPMFSPDGKRLGVSDGLFISVVDIASGSSARFTFTEAGEPTWSPDGKWIAFASKRGGNFDISEKLASNAGTEQVIVESNTSKYMDDWSPDGRFLIFEQVDPKTRSDLWIVPMAGTRTARPFLATPYNELHARFSPDGKWVAYASDESGRFEIYVRDFPAANSKYQVSSQGGAEPQWSADSCELYFVAFNKELMAVPITAQNGDFQSGTPQPLFQTHTAGILDQRNYYAATKDRNRFLVVAPFEENAAPISVILNWTSELKNK